MKKPVCTIVAAALLAATPAHPAGHASAECRQALDRLAWLDRTVRQSLTDLEAVRRQAQGLSEWFGAEHFDAYVAALRKQEATLRAQLQDLRQAGCGE